MCAGIGRVAFGAQQPAALALTGYHPDDTTLCLPCRAVFASGQGQALMEGSVAQADRHLLQTHHGFWEQRSA